MSVLLVFLLILCTLPSSVVAVLQYSNNQAIEGTQNQQKTQVQETCFHKPKKFILNN